jgi:enediyne biosynthesis protein E4
LVQDAPNPDAIGAWIELRQGERLQRRENFLGGGHASGQAGWVHFGLGASPDAEVRVTWPDGTIGPWQKIAQGFSQITKGQSIKSWTPTP